MPDFLTKRLVAERYGISVRTVDRWIEKNILPPPFKIETRDYFSKQQLEERDEARSAEGGAS